MKIFGILTFLIIPYILGIAAIILILWMIYKAFTHTPFVDDEVKFSIDKDKVECPDTNATIKLEANKTNK